MTERLYLADPYLDRFRARVVAARDLDGHPMRCLSSLVFLISTIAGQRSWRRLRPAG